jgi:radical SAM superfamily enzyme YgiQ (UPF0313 family)
MSAMIDHLNATRNAPFTAAIGPRNEARALRVCVINPRFEPSFWNYDFVLPMFDGDKRCWMASGALPILAALAPPGVSVELLDENVRAIDWDDLRRFDVIGVTGMIVQRRRMLEILRKIEGLPAIVAVGGPYITISEAEFAGLCDVRFIGEADDTWPEFLRAVAAGEPAAERYAQAQRTDVTKLPAPRYDLLEMGRYMSAPVQFSRGCPFECEFCDIITIFGRRPRVKTSEQLIAEVEAVRRAGARIVFLVDDNFIGNKAAAKNMLPALIAWQRENGYPIQFSTEASVNLADEAELMELMVQANFRQVFIGLESPRADSLNETRKFQNTRGDSMLAKIARVRDAGLVPIGGFIVGFDNDDAAIFEEQFRFVQDSGIGQAAVAILSPLPTTPLYDRLAAAGRLDDSDSEVAFIPEKMTQRELREGHTRLMRRLYEPEAYLGRIFKGYAASSSFRRRRARIETEIGKVRLTDRVLRMLATVRTATRLGRALARTSMFGRLAPVYLRFYGRNLALGRGAMPLHNFVTLCLTHWHFYNMARHERKASFGNPSIEARATVAGPA